VGARHALFPVAIVWHQPRQVDCSPTLFSVTCGVVGLIAGPFKVLGEVYLPAQPVVAATDLWTRLGHASITFAS
jgi:hypothetical protein